MTRARNGAAWGLLALALLFAAGCGRDGEAWRAELVPTPRPQLKEPDPAFSQRLDALEAAIGEQLARDPVEPRALAAAQGELGFFYLAYLEVEAAPPPLENARRADPKDWRWPYLLGFIAQVRGELAAAAGFYDQALRCAPAEVGPRLRLAEVEVERGNAETAAVQLGELRRLAPDLPAALFQEARLADRQGDARTAALLLEKVVAAQPGASAARYLLGQVYRKLGREDEARQALAAGGEERVKFDDPLLLRLDELGVSEGFYRLRASRAFEARDYAGAAAACRRLFSLGPGRFGDHQRLAFSLYRLGQKSEARAELERARARPDAANAPAAERIEAHRLAAVLLLEANDRGGAIRELRAALAALEGTPPGHETLRLLLAETLGREGDSGGALAVYDDWLGREPQNARALLERGLLRLSGGDRGGRADLHRAAELAPADASLQRRCGEAFDRLGEAEAARRAFTAASRDSAPPRDPEEAFARAIALAHLANAERREGRAEAAEALYRRSLALLPALEVRLNLADLLLARDAFAEAAELYAAAAAQDQQNVDARLGEAGALILLGRFAAARAALERGVAALPRAGELRHLLARLLASAPESGDRDPARALALALEVVQAKATSQHAETLAMALAENGRFAEAAGLLRQLLAEGQKREGPRLVAYWQDQLAAYEKNRPFRASPPRRFFRPQP